MNPRALSLLSPGLLQKKNMDHPIAATHGEGDVGDIAHYRGPLLACSIVIFLASPSKRELVLSRDMHH